MMRCPRCSYQPLQREWSWCPRCAAPISAAAPAPEQTAADGEWRRNDQLLLAVALLLGFLILVSIFSLVLFILISATWSDVLWWTIGGFIALRLLWWGRGPKKATPPRRIPSDGAHDAAVALSAVLGVRDGVRRE